jgi:hypothetical protein
MSASRAWSGVPLGGGPGWSSTASNRSNVTTNRPVYGSDTSFCTRTITEDQPPFVRTFAVR